MPDLCRDAAADRDITGELSTLIGIEDLGLAVAIQSLFESIHAEIGVQAGRETPAQHVTTEPVHHGDQIEKTSGHRDVPVCRSAAPKIRQAGPDLRRDAAAGGGMRHVGAPFDRQTKAELSLRGGPGSAG